MSRRLAIVFWTAVALALAGCAAAGDGMPTVDVVEAGSPDPGGADPGNDAVGIPDIGASDACPEAADDAVSEDVASDVAGTSWRVAGDYEIASTFDLAALLPQPIKIGCNVLASFLLDPSGALPVGGCSREFGDPPPLGRLCDYLFADPVDPSLDELTSVGEIVVRIIATMHLSLVPERCVDPYPLVRMSGNALGSEIGFLLSHLRLRSTMTCAGEPAAQSTSASGTCREQWRTLGVSWRQCGACDAANPAACSAEWPLAAIPGIGDLSPTDLGVQRVPGPALAIAEHPVSLQMGALIGFVFERALLPALFGDGRDGMPAVDSYEDLLGALLGGKACIYGGTCCYDFARDVLAQTGTIEGLTASLIEGACDALIISLAGELRFACTDLDTMEPAAFDIGTPDGAPCPVADADGDGTIDRLGAASSPCTWNARLSVGGAKASSDAAFFGILP